MTMGTVLTVIREGTGNREPKSQGRFSVSLTQRTVPMILVINRTLSPRVAVRAGAPSLASRVLLHGHASAPSTGAYRPVLTEKYPLDIFPGVRTTENSTLCCFPGDRCHCGGEANRASPPAGGEGDRLRWWGFSERIAVRCSSSER